MVERNRELKRENHEPRKSFHDELKHNPKSSEPTSTAKEYHLTDMGNAERLVDRYGDILRFSYAWNKWLVWDGIRWVKDDGDIIAQKAKDTVKGIYEEASKTMDSGRRKELGGFALRCEQAFRIEQMIALARSERGVAVKPDDLDKDDWLLNCQNGMIDLHTGKLLPHNREHLITKVLPINYNPDAKCELWPKFLNEIMDGNQGLISFLKRAVGMSLTGDTSERAIFMLYGTGRNGKTTFLTTTQTILGDYAQEMPMNALMIEGHEAASEDVARLFKIRFVISTEGREGQKLNESKIKRLSGRDKVAARFLYGHIFEFFPTHKNWIGTNYKPVIRESADAIWDRVKLIPFQVAIPEEKQDKHLRDKLLEEAEGILAWAVEGCLEWQRDGLGVPPEVRKATQAYREEMDIVANWIEDCCLIGEEYSASAKSLYERYQTWCKENGEPALNQTRFGKRLAEKGFEKHRSPAIQWKGIGLLSDYSSF